MQVYISLILSFIRNSAFYLNLTNRVAADKAEWWAHMHCDNLNKLELFKKTIRNSSFLHAMNFLCTLYKTIKKKWMRDLFPIRDLLVSHSFIKLPRSPAYNPELCCFRNRSIKPSLVDYSDRSAARCRSGRRGADSNENQLRGVLRGATRVRFSTSPGSASHRRT